MSTTSRADGRKPAQIRPLSFQVGLLPHADGSCLIQMGGTQVLCAATIIEKLPPFLRDAGHGWVTAEYGMLPCSTHDRVDREAARGKQSGRTQEIQRLIGRSLRAVVDLKGLGERQIKIDCDVILADGGTRCASISGAYVALHQAMQKLVDEKKIKALPLLDQVAALSCGIVEGQAVSDLCYTEDSTAHADANFIMTPGGKIIEIQATAEDTPFGQDQFQEMLSLAQQGISEIAKAQLQAIYGDKGDAHGLETLSRHG